MSDFLHWLDTISSEQYFLAAIFVFALADSIIPAAPSEFSVILGGIAAANEAYVFPAVLILAALGAFCGDNISYQIGHRFRGWIDRKAKKSERFAKSFDWANKQIATRGGLMLITARFIPGGRTAATLSWGATDAKLSNFMPWAALAAVLWATYAGSLGFFFGNTFKDNHTLALFLAFAASFTVSGVIELVKYLRERKETADQT